MEPVHIMTVGEMIVFSVALIVTGIVCVLFVLAPEEKGSSMLVLTRQPKPQEDLILIGDDIVIQIQSVRGENVKVGIQAPRGVQVIRGELAGGQIVGPKIPLSFQPVPMDSRT